MQLKAPGFIVFFLLLFLNAFGQVSPECKLRIGTNLAGPADWGAEYPFVNIMKYSRTWISHNNVWVGGGQNDWDTQVLDQMEFDENGYPLYLPVDVPGEEAPQIVRTVWANTEALPEGRYVVLYEGVGDLDVWGDATLISEEPGRLEFDLQYQGDLFALEIYESQEGDHVRNIRVLLPGTEATYQTDPWTPSWLEKLEPFNALRFMDWGYTNNSEMRQWQQRTQVNDYTWTQKNGVPYEMWADLCNQKKADPWICVPHAANDEFITQMATYFRDNIDPELSIYVEYSNEVWNWLFSQAQYGLDSLDQNLEWPERLAPRIAHVMQIWSDVFAGQTHRLVRVQGGQHGWYDIGRRIFLQLEAEGNDHLIDAISPAAYMGLDNDWIENNWDENTTGQEVLDHAEEYTFALGEWAMEGWYYHAQLAAEKGKKLLFYEGGQHFTPHVFGQVPEYCDALIDCQTLPDMYELYNQLYDTLRTLSDQEMLLMNFSFISAKSCQYGTWGLVQHQFNENEPYDNVPKYRAVKDNIELFENCQEVVSLEEINDFSVRVYPNPTNDIIKVEWGNMPLNNRKIFIYDLMGNIIYKKENIEIIYLANYPAGIYLMEVVGGGKKYNELIVKQ